MDCWEESDNCKNHLTHLRSLNVIIKTWLTCFSPFIRFLSEYKRLVGRTRTGSLSMMRGCSSTHIVTASLSVFFFFIHTKTFDEQLSMHLDTSVLEQKFRCVHLISPYQINIKASHFGPFTHINNLITPGIRYTYFYGQVNRPNERRPEACVVKNQKKKKKPTQELINKAVMNNNHWCHSMML